MENIFGDEGADQGAQEQEKKGDMESHGVVARYLWSECQQLIRENLKQWVKRLPPGTASPLLKEVEEREAGARAGTGASSGNQGWVAGRTAVEEWGSERGKEQ